MVHETYSIPIDSDKAKSFKYLGGCSARPPLCRQLRHPASTGEGACGRDRPGAILCCGVAACDPPLALRLLLGSFVNRHLPESCVIPFAIQGRALLGILPGSYRELIDGWSDFVNDIC